jgi:hypothetical protein
LSSRSKESEWLEVLDAARETFRRAYERLEPTPAEKALRL